MFRTNLIVLSILSALTAMGCGTPGDAEYGDRDHDFRSERKSASSLSIKANGKTIKDVITASKDVVVVEDEDDTWEKIGECLDNSTDTAECQDCCADEFDGDPSGQDICDLECEEQCEDPDDTWDKIGECLDNNTNTADCQDCCADAFDGDPSGQEICDLECDDLCEDPDDCGDVIGIGI